MDERLCPYCRWHHAYNIIAPDARRPAAQAEQLEELLGALERRGPREGALALALSQRRGDLLAGMPAPPLRCAPAFSACRGALRARTLRRVVRRGRRACPQRSAAGCLCPRRARALCTHFSAPGSARGPCIAAPFGDCAEPVLWRAPGAFGLRRMSRGMQDAGPPRRLPPPVERWKPADRARADERLCAWVAAARTLAAAAPPTPAAARAEAEAAGVPGDGPLAARLKADLLRLEARLLQRGALAPAWRSAPWRKARRPGPHACPQRGAVWRGRAGARILLRARGSGAAARAGARAGSPTQMRGLRRTPVQMAQAVHRQCIATF